VEPEQQIFADMDIDVMQKCMSIDFIIDIGRLLGFTRQHHVNVTSGSATLASLEGQQVPVYLRRRTLKIKY